MNSQYSNVTVTRDEADKYREAAADAILIRAGVQMDRPSPGADDLRSMRLKDLAVECVAKNGNGRANNLNDEELLREALSPDSQFSSIVSTAANKSAAIAYNAAPTTYKAWTSRGSNPNFKTATHYQISEAGGLEMIPEKREIRLDDVFKFDNVFKFDEMEDRGVHKSVATFGRSWGFSRQAIINDELDVLAKIPQAYTRAAYKGINRLVYMQLGANIRIFDGLPLFHADHFNLAVNGGAIGIDSVGEGRVAMKTQKNLRGMEVINASPAILIVPSIREADARKFVDTNTRPTTFAEVNPFAGKLLVVTDSELDSYSPTAWYLAADPKEVETIEVTYLNDTEVPTIESKVSFETLGINFRIYIDYGVTVLDYRGLYKNSGI